jgi:hypothetical protein
LHAHLAALVDAVERRQADHWAANEVARAYLLDSLRTTDLRAEDARQNVIRMFEKDLAALARAQDAALASASAAVVKAEQASERRFESVNEFRAQLGDVIRTFMPRAEVEARADANAARITELGRQLDILVSRVDIRDGRTAGHGDSTRNLATIVGLVLGALTIAVSIWLATHQ